MVKIILFAVLLLIGSPINASEENGHFRLFYVFSDQCVFCKAWERDVGRLYEDTEYAKKAPLFKIDIDHVSKYLTVVTTKVSGTPTFIVMNKNDEVGRIVGYQNRDMFFWALSKYIPH